jgi:hypothetical protein
MDISTGQLRSIFGTALMGGSQGAIYLPDRETRARWLVADAMRVIAKQEERAMASRLRILAGWVESGQMPTKRIINKIGNKRMDKVEDEFVRLTRERLK